MDASVSVQNLTKTFGKFHAVNNISFTVKPGEIFGFLGPNGAGKSTTIKMLCGIHAPTSGSGTVAGFDIVHEQKEIKTRIGYMSQKFSLYEDLTVVENLEFYGSIYGLDRKFLNERIEIVLKMAEIDKERDFLVKSLPGGIKQRLALGGAILHNPPILFLDEPTSGVDPIMRRNFWEIIYDFSSQGKTIFVTTHYMDESEHCDRIALIIAGTMMALDTPDNLKKNLPYSVYSLKVPDFMKVFDLVAGLDYITEASIFGSEIHLLCADAVPLPEKIEPVIRSAGIEKYSLEKILPTLEDVFVTNVRNSQK